MIISNNIPLDADKVIAEISNRQQAPWNDGRINDYCEYTTLQKLYAYINSGIPQEDFFYKGDLFRIHTSYVILSASVDSQKERIVSKVWSDDSCRALSYTEYSSKLVAFSKAFAFTDNHIFYKVDSTEKSILLHVNTQSHYGIDVNVLLKRYGIVTRYENEQEVLFPLEEEFVVKEYFGTPNKFKYYLRGQNI